MSAKHLTPHAARRIGHAARDDGDTDEQLRYDVDSWFADVYGWPLTVKEAEARDTFLTIAREAREGR